MGRIVDLSHVIRDGAVTDPRLPAARVKPIWTREASAPRYAPGVSFQIASATLPQNTGTYIDCPFHRFENGAGVWDFPLERLVGLDGVVVKAQSTRHRAQTGERGIGPELFEGVEVRGRAVLVWTGADARWGTQAYSYNTHPFLTRAGAESLAERGAALFGLDAINADDFADLERPAHSLLLGAGIPIVENLRGLAELAALLKEERGGARTGFRFSAAPVKVEGCGSFPVRAYAEL